MDFPFKWPEIRKTFPWLHVIVVEGESLANFLHFLCFDQHSARKRYSIRFKFQAFLGRCRTIPLKWACSSPETDGIGMLNCFAQKVKISWLEYIMILAEFLLHTLNLSAPYSKKTYNFKSNTIDYGDWGNITDENLHCGPSLEIYDLENQTQMHYIAKLGEIHQIRVVTFTRGRKFEVVNVELSWCLSLSWWRHQMEIFFRVTGPLCGEFSGHRWIPHTKASDAEPLFFLWSVLWINGWVNNR